MSETTVIREKTYCLLLDLFDLNHELCLVDRNTCDVVKRHVDGMIEKHRIMFQVWAKFDWPKTHFLH